LPRSMPRDELSTCLELCLPIGGSILRRDVMPETPPSPPIRGDGSSAVTKEPPSEACRGLGFTADGSSTRRGPKSKTSLSSRDRTGCVDLATESALEAAYEPEALVKVSIRPAVVGGREPKLSTPAAFASREEPDFTGLPAILPLVNETAGGLVGLFEDITTMMDASDYKEIT